MLLTEWNWDDAKQVWREEGREEGMEKGMEKGIEQGREVVARNAIAKGVPLKLISDITGIDINTLQNIQTQQAQ